MTREIYDALLKRISVADEKTTLEYFEQYPQTNPSVVVYYFDATGLNSNKDYDFMDNIILGVKTHNRWNVAQRFYSFIRNYMHADERLLMA